MYTLAFDTTVDSCAVALFKDTAEIACYEEKTTFGQAEALIPAIKNILQKNELEFSSLSLVAVCCGPGSFTGVRSSISAARAFALACPETAVCGVSAFDAYAADFKPEETAEVNAVLIETKREDFYVQYYDGNLNRLDAPGTAYYEDIVRFLKGKKVTVAGNGAERFLSRPTGLCLHTVKMQQTPPIDKLALLAIKNFHNKTLNFPKPLYLKAPDVCVK